MFGGDRQDLLDTLELELHLVQIIVHVRIDLDLLGFAALLQVDHHANVVDDLLQLDRVVLAQFVVDLQVLLLRRHVLMDGDQILHRPRQCVELLEVGDHDLHRLQNAVHRFHLLQARIVEVDHIFAQLHDLLDIVEASVQLLVVVQRLKEQPAEVVRTVTALALAEQSEQTGVILSKGVLLEDRRMVLVAEHVQFVEGDRIDVHVALALEALEPPDAQALALFVGAQFVLVEVDQQ